MEEEVCISSHAMKGTTKDSLKGACLSWVKTLAVTQRILSLIPS
jgi:hypothetical protein